MLTSFMGGLSPEVFFGLLATSWFASFMTASLGIGGGTLMIAVLATLLPPPLIVPLHGVIQLGSNAGRALILFSSIRRDHVPGFLLGTLVGVLIGGLVAVDLDAGAIQLIVGVFILWSLFFSVPRLLTRASWLAGGVSSFLTMFVGGTGPFVAAFVRAGVPEKVPFVATSAALMTIQHGLKTVVFVALGVSFLPWLPFLAAMIAAGFAGTWLGQRVLLRVPEELFRRVLAILLGLMALRLIWTGLA